ncbi:MAG: adenylate/guanylate cyclase domain-containing protein [Dehalococcoidia bacterium]
MEPRIQYTKTSDAVSIAYCEAGVGTPFIEDLWTSNIELEFRDWEWHRIMAARRRLIRFDHRGSGLSQRDAADLSVEAMALDIGAVADALELQTFALEGEVWGVPVAIAYAATHPERVSHLILFAGYASPAEFYEIPRVKTLFAMLDQGDWELFTDTMALVQLGWPLANVAHGLGELSRASQTLKQAQAYFRASREHDVTGLLSQVRVPTLVLHPRGTPYPTLEMAQKLAAAIPGARLKVLESSALWSDEMEPQYLAALDEFIGDGGRPTAAQVLPHVQRVAQEPAALATMLFTDITDSTALTQRLGDANAQKLVRAHNAIVREALTSYSGTEIKHTGDGIMASFPTASGALECAIAIQRGVDDYNSDSLPASRDSLAVHIGVNAGEPVAEESDLFGTAVQLARRICDHAEAGQILVSNVVRELAAGKGFLFADIGEVLAKGFEEPVRLYEALWRE